MAVMYSKLGGCLGDTAKLGPLARTDLCAWVKGLLDNLVTHLWLGYSKEDPWGAYSGEGVPSLELALGALSLAECLTACLRWGVIACPGRTFSRREVGTSFLGSSADLVKVGTCLPSCEETKPFPSWGIFLWEGGLLGETVLTAWEVVLSPESLGRI